MDAQTTKHWWGYWMKIDGWKHRPINRGRGSRERRERERERERER